MAELPAMNGFSPGEKVRVRLAFPPGHVRAPVYIRGRRGVVEEYAGLHQNPEDWAYGRTAAPKIALYRVRFAQRDLWPDYAGGPADSLVVDVFENWLEAAP
ncbi:MAG: hypothetical protein OHK0024_34010 [Thalassobaculales bacterium]